MTRLTLTTAGCSYLAKQTGITGITITGGCEVDVLFVENRIGNGGVIRYGNDDEWHLEISESQVIGAIPMDVDRPWNSNQQWVMVWIFAAMGLLAAVLFLMIWDSRQDEKRKKLRKAEA